MTNLGGNLQTAEFPPFHVIVQLMDLSFYITAQRQGTLPCIDPQHRSGHVNDQFHRVEVGADAISQSFGFFKGMSMHNGYPQIVSRSLGNLSYKHTQMLRGIKFKLIRKLWRMSKFKFITINIYSSVANIGGISK
jgi:hypothetical protein